MANFKVTVTLEAEVYGVERERDARRAVMDVLSLDDVRIISWDVLEVDSEELERDEEAEEGEEDNPFGFNPPANPPIFNPSAGFSSSHFVEADFNT